MRHRIARIALALATAVCTLAAPGTARATLVDFFYLDSCSHAAYTDMAIHPPAITRNGVTYVAIQGKNLDPHAFSYDHASKTWTGPVKAGDNPLVGDSHGAPALVIDNAGYLHIFFGGHHTGLKHARSTNPYDVRSWTQMPDIATSFTYPEAMVHPDGTIELFYRAGWPVPGWSSKKSTDNGVTWGAAEPVLFGSTTEGYYANFNPGPNGEVYATAVGLSWTDYFGGGDWARSDVFFFKRTTDGVWRAADGTALTTPVTLDEARTRCLVFPSGSANANQCVTRADKDGNPVVLFLTGSGGGPNSYMWKYSRWNGASWSTSDIAGTDHFFDGGTIDVRPDGSVDAYVTSGGTLGLGTSDREYTDIGGYIVRYRAAESSAPFALMGRIDPGGAGLLYNAPQVVEGDSDAARVFFAQLDRPNLYASPSYVWGDGGLLGTNMTPRVSRVYGSNRALTSVQVSKNAYPMAPVQVVLARQDAFADALAGAPLAYAVQGPILLTARDSLPTAVANEIKRLKPGRVIVLGGTGAVSDGVVRSVKALRSGLVVERVGGADRFATAAAIARRLKKASVTWPGQAVVVSANSYTDALSAGSYAAISGSPILLATRDRIPAATGSVISELGIGSTLVVGGERSVGATAVAHLPSPTRIAGADRYATAAAMTSHGLANGLIARHLTIASGTNFPDGLVGGVLAARLHGPVLLTAPSFLPTATAGAISANASTTVDVKVLGGTAVITSGTVAAIRRALGL